MITTRKFPRRAWVVAIVLAVALAAPTAAQAWWRRGWGFGFGPIFIPAPAGSPCSCLANNNAHVGGQVR